MQQLRDKLAVAERTAKAEAQLKVRFSVLCSLAYVIFSRIFLIADHDLITDYTGKVPRALQGFGGEA